MSELPDECTPSIDEAHRLANGDTRHEVPHDRQLLISRMMRDILIQLIVDPCAPEAEKQFALEVLNASDSWAFSEQSRD